MEIIKSTPIELHPLDRAAHSIGGRSAMAVLLGVSVAAIGNWKVRGVPLGYCVPIEVATGGTVGRCDLRPNDYLDVWPELAHAAAPIPTDIPSTGPDLDRAMSEAAKAGLIERRSLVRRADDRARLAAAGQGV